MSRRQLLLPVRCYSCLQMEATAAGSLPLNCPLNTGSVEEKLGGISSMMPVQQQHHIVLTETVTLVMCSAAMTPPVGNMWCVHRTLSRNISLSRLTRCMSWLTQAV